MQPRNAGRPCAPLRFHAFNHFALLGIELDCLLPKQRVEMSLSSPARGVRSTLGLVGGSGPQQPDPSTTRDTSVALVSPLSTALVGLVMVRIAVGSGPDLGRHAVSAV